MGLTRNFLATLTLLAAALIAPLSPAVADGGPFLVLDTGVHEAAINAMAPLADGGGIVTVSDDKTALFQTLDVRVGQMGHYLGRRLIDIVHDVAQASGLELRPEPGPDLIAFLRAGVPTRHPGLGGQGVGKHS